MEFKMNEASIEDALKVLKENTRPFDLMAELENRMREFTESNLLFEEATGAKERGRAIRLPTMIPTEITVGQTPSSQERADFEKWMSNIGGSGSVAEKLKLISDYFDKPREQIENSSIPEVLSFLMFLNYFTWMLKEFNASVAGFLWEPFLAALFGGESRQVPTSEGDIADIRIDTPTASEGEKGEPISLKILNKKGEIKGSFKDLVDHFAGTEGRPPGTNMRYIIVVKEQNKDKNVQSVDFYQFDINIETFFTWMGSLKHTEVIKDRSVKFNLNIDSLPASKRSLFRRGEKAGADQPKSKTLNMRHASVTKDKSPVLKPKWIRIYNIVKGPDGSQMIAGPEVEEISLHMSSPLNTGYVRPGDRLDPEGTYTAIIAQYEAGGRTKSPTPGARVAAGYEEMPGAAGKGVNKIWGGLDERSQFAAIAKDALNPDTPTTAADFWNAVKDKSPGYKTNQQFHISPSHYAKGGARIGKLKIADRTVANVFKLGAEQIGPQMTEMFNAMADLTDNIGRFFLTDCGDASGPKKCTKRDVKNQDKAGQTAIQNSQTLKVAVEKSVAQMKGTGETRMDYSVSPPKLTHAEE